jgi:uncharacterized protein Yka (UPF0111/DUF47 family)
MPTMGSSIVGRSDGAPKLVRIPLPAFLGQLSGTESRRRFVNLLVAHLDTTTTGATLTRLAVSGEIARGAAVERMRVVEHIGDAQQAELGRALKTALVTPIDREDLFRLSRAIDDVLDNLRDFLTEWSLFEMERSPVIEPVCDVIVSALMELSAAVASLDREPGGVTLRAQAAKKSGNVIRHVYEIQLAALFRGEFSMRTLKERDLLRRLDVVGLRLGTAANILSDAAVKRAES